MVKFLTLFSIPNGLPPPPIRLPSPPELPPGVLSVFQGFLVIPQIGLLHPKLYVKRNSIKVYD